jgi:hypothetical protein
MKAAEAAEVLAAVERRLLEARNALSAAEADEQKTVSALGAAIAAGENPADQRVALRDVRDRLEEQRAALPFLEAAVVEARTARDTAERAERQRHLRELAEERLRIAEDAENAVVELLALLQESRKLSQETAAVATRHGLQDRFRNDERIEGWIFRRLHQLWPYKFQANPYYDASLPEIEHATLSELLS